MSRRARGIIVGTALGVVAAAGALVALPWTHDMDDQLSLKPQEMSVPPPEFSVPIGGREFPKDRALEAAQANPVPADAASLARGERLFRIYCTVCHGPRGEGMGPVVKKGFLAPPPLTGATARGRSDGYLYSYLRRGGLIAMPTYSFALQPRDAWDVVNHMRRLQAETPAP